MRQSKSIDIKGQEALSIPPNPAPLKDTFIRPSQREQPFLDSRLFRAFMAAAETENFTFAAEKTFMTQSGISQHIAKLENQIGLPLFKRVAKRITLTNTGKRLKKHIEAQNNETENFLSELREEYYGMTGSVNFVMPSSCLLLPNFLLLLSRRKQQPLITLNVKIAPSHDIVRMVSEDQVDFGLSTRKTDHPNLVFKAFSQEEYVLVASSPKALDGINVNNVYKFPCIAYPGVDVFFNGWLKHHFPNQKNLDFLSLPISGTIDSIEGAIRMVREGIGISIFPKHCIENLLIDKQLFEFKTQTPPLINNLYIVSLRNYAYPLAVRQVMLWLNREPESIAKTTQ
ncbi:MAG: LysR family transcriptional regulator [Candidatus Thiodiazotropha sp.]